MIENFMAITKVPRFLELSAKVKAVWPFLNITLVLGVFYPRNSAAKGLIPPIFVLVWYFLPIRSLTDTYVIGDQQ